MGMKSEFNNYNFNVELTSLSFVEFKVESNRYCGPTTNCESTKYYRNIDKIYRANIAIEKKPLPMR